MADFNSRLQKLSNVKEWMSVRDLEPYIKHPIYTVYRCITKYGEKVVVELADLRFILPTRYDSLTDQDLQRLGENNRYCIYSTGRFGKTTKIHFEEIEEAATAASDETQ